MSEDWDEMYPNESYLRKTYDRQTTIQVESDVTSGMVMVFTRICRCVCLCVGIWKDLKEIYKEETLHLFHLLLSSRRNVYHFLLSKQKKTSQGESKWLYV